MEKKENIGLGSLLLLKQVVDALQYILLLLLQQQLLIYLFLNLLVTIRYLTNFLFVYSNLLCYDNYRILKNVNFPNKQQVLMKRHACIEISRGTVRILSRATSLPSSERLESCQQ